MVIFNSYVSLAEGIMMKCHLKCAASSAPQEAPTADDQEGWRAEVWMGILPSKAMFNFI
jgi:hypothetical protein